MFIYIVGTVLRFEFKLLSKNREVVNTDLKPAQDYVCMADNVSIAPSFMQQQVEKKKEREREGR